MKFQRDVVQTKTEWERDVARLRSEAEAAREPEAVARTYGRLGDYLRLHESTVAEAVEVLQQAVQAAKDADAASAFVANVLRLATALQYAARHNEAVSAFREALAFVEQHKDDPDVTLYEDFIWQHLGKCYVETGRLAEARRCFDEALTLRLGKAKESLIASTKRALEGLAEIEQSAAYTRDDE